MKITEIRITPAADRERSSIADGLGKHIFIDVAHPVNESFCQQVKQVILSKFAFIQRLIDSYV
jgi:hypothetical protein